MTLGTARPYERAALRAFEGCTTLVDLFIGENVSSISPYAFAGCTGLEYAKIPGTIKLLGSYAFKGCTSLAEVDILSGVETIGYGAFEDCTSLEDIDFGSTVDTIESEAFKGCTSLKSVTLPGRTTYSERAFDESVSISRESDGWKTPALIGGGIVAVFAIIGAAVIIRRRM